MNECEKSNGSFGIQTVHLKKKRKKKEEGGCGGDDRRDDSIFILDRNPYSDTKVTAPKRVHST